MTYNQRRAEKAIERARIKRIQLEHKYNGAAVWMGGDCFIIVKDGKEIEVEG